MLITITSKPTKKTLLAITFCTGIIFLLLPCVLFLSNAAEWGYQTSPLILIASLGLIFWLVSITIALVCYRVPTLNGFIAVLFSTVGVAVYLNDAFSPLQLHVLDGSEQSSPEPLSNTIIEFTLLLLSAFFIWHAYQAKKQWLSNLLSYGSIVAAALFVICIFYGNYQLTPLAKQPPSVSSELKLPNVYHLHMDAMQTDFFLHAVQERKQQDEFAGFEIYKNNISPYLFSSPSIGSYLTSSIYNPDDSYAQWVNSSGTGMLTTLAQKGYKLSLYAKPTLFDVDKFSTYTSSDQILSDNLDQGSLTTVDFVRLWLARVLPNPLTNEALIWGEQLSQAIEPQTGFPNSIKEGIEPYSGVLLMQRLTADEPQRNAHNEYVLAQPLIPHGPNVIDENCRYKPIAAAQFAPEYYKQVVCSTELIITFLQTLKSLDRYDNSLIVIHGDHGSGWAGNLKIVDKSITSTTEYGLRNSAFKPEILPWSIDHIKSRSMALLMIKRPNSSNEPLSISAFESTNIDIYPTMAAVLNLKTKPGALTGLDLFSADALTTKRKRNVYYFKPGKTHKKDISTFNVICTLACEEMTIRPDQD